MGPGIQFKALALHARGPEFNFKFKEKKNGSFPCEGKEHTYNLTATFF